MEPKSSPSILVHDIMTHQVHFVSPTMTVREAITLLTTYKISGAPVCDLNLKVLSVISEGNLLKLVATSGLDAKISQCMDKLPKEDTLVTVKKSDPFTEAYKKFLLKGIHRIIVIDDNGKLQGIVSRSNVLRVLVEA